MNKCLLALMWMLCFSAVGLAQSEGSQQKNLPIGVFDSGTGGLTVLEAILRLDEYNNETGRKGSDGKPDFEKEAFQYLGDQANMPYGNYASEHKTPLLKENILKCISFLLGKEYASIKSSKWATHSKDPVKMIVVACNTATAYALEDIKSFTQNETRPKSFPVIGVINAGCKAALSYQQMNKGSIAIFATVGTIASEGYPSTLKSLASSYGLNDLVIVSQGCMGLAESIDNDLSFIDNHATTTRPYYKGPSMKNNKYPIDTTLLSAYSFQRSQNKLLCETDAKNNCLDLQLNDPSNYVRYYLVTLMEKMKKDNIALPLNTLILGCTHYPYLRDTIQYVLNQMYNYKVGDNFVYRQYLSPHVMLIDPAMETAKEAYESLRQNNLSANQVKPSQHRFFISIPNSELTEIALQSDGWFTYDYKYGRECSWEKKYTKFVLFDNKNISTATYTRFRTMIPLVYKAIKK